MAHRFGWVLFALLLPILLMIWGEITLINGTLGWRILLFALVVLGVGATLEARSQDHGAGETPDRAEGRQPFWVGLRDALLTISGSVLGVLALLLIVVVLRYVGEGRH